MALFYMKDFSGTKIPNRHPSLNWDAQKLVYAHDGSKITANSGTLEPNGNIRWTCEKDGYLVCHVWGSNSGKLTIYNINYDMLMMTLGNPTSNTNSPQRSWMPVYQGIAYSILISDGIKYSQAMYIPFLD